MCIYIYIWGGGPSQYGNIYIYIYREREMVNWYHYVYTHIYIYIERIYIYIYTYIYTRIVSCVLITIDHMTPPCFYTFSFDANRVSCTSALWWPEELARLIICAHKTGPHIFTHTHTYIYIYIYIYLFMYIYIYVYIYIYIYIFVMLCTALYFHNQEKHVLYHATQSWSIFSCASRFAFMSMFVVRFLFFHHCGVSLS